MPAAWPFPVSDKFEQAVEVTTPKVTRKPKAKKAATTKKKAQLKQKQPIPKRQHPKNLANDDCW
jgi:hypothetical protein